MDRVVSYDYPIDNKEEMKMKNVRVEDECFDQAEVSVGNGVQGTVVYLDFDPDGYSDCQTLMQYSPDQARQLAADLMEAASLADKGVL